jgi:hypothetical protein
VQGGVELAVAAGVEQVALLVAAGDVQGRGSGVAGEVVLAGKATNVADVAQELGGHHHAKAVDLGQGAAGGRQRVPELGLVVGEAGVDRTNTQKVLRAIAGFANANGGTLLIGVDNDDTAVGVNEDYQFVSRGNRDGFELLIRSLVHDRIPKLASTLFDIGFDLIDGKDICRIGVRPSPSPLFCRSTKNPDLLDFWVRLGGSTRPLTGPDLLAHQRERWP